MIRELTGSYAPAFACAAPCSSCSASQRRYGAAVGRDGETGRVEAGRHPRMGRRQRQLVTLVELHRRQPAGGTIVPMQHLPSGGARHGRRRLDAEAAAAYTAEYLAAPNLEHVAF
jgi:hypothetical protein